MGIDFEELKNKARGLVEKHGDKIEGGLDKASDFAKKKFGHEEQIDRAVDTAKGFIREEREAGKPVERPEDKPGQDERGPGA
jgi:antitoxin protein of toxin-antitoxin system